MNITGLGAAIAKGGVLEKLIVSIYKYLLKNGNVQSVFVQNASIRWYCIKNHIAIGKLKQIPGFGVNIHQFCYFPFPDYEAKYDFFLFVSRVMKEKEIEEYVQAASKINVEYPNVRFGIVGTFERNYKEYLESAQNDGIIEYYGVQADIVPLYKQCSALVLLSFYYEEMSNVLFDASACVRQGGMKTLGKNTEFDFSFGKVLSCLWQTVRKPNARHLMQNKDWCFSEGGC